ncbi:uroporphyrinogen decarboxylase [Desulfurivibrio dismutans]|uniref:uroporphyrinogen decarboxylase n=1 Tax=Desulfurivibrio dismutans TaxID=1398908 RepID=UPI0023DBBEA8|nr:uroporphyrinogen decarboxylase [Desulfurivibrio alkaliphilus]MDF1614005.1 uroporphyrinogen decarboxylase [Desulfurivibrio alkaliphilus]
MNTTFLKACRGEPVDYTPVWMMRQAGRYLPEYHTVRRQYTFLEMCKTPEAAAEVTIQPVDLIGVDAAILFSDILVIPEAMGAPLEFQEQRGPVFPEPVRDQAAVDRLIVPDPEDKLGYVMATIRLLRRELATKVPLIGFAGAPFTNATYMIEGGSSKNFFLTKKMMYTAPELYGQLLDKITESTILYLKAQAAAGAQALQIFDSWAGVLAPRDFAEFALPYVKRIITALKEGGVEVPLIYFANNGATLLEQSKTVGADVLGLDWRINLDEAAKIVGPGIALQGNLDPCALLLPHDKLEERVARILEQGKAAHGHIFNLGHGILPEIPPAQAKFMVDAVHRLSRRA